MKIDKYDLATLDFETLNTTSDSKVLSIGIVPFNFGEKVTFDELLTRESSLYLKFRLDGQDEFGLTESESTRVWWEGIGEKASHVIWPSEQDVDLESAMKRITDHLTHWVKPIAKDGSNLYCRGYDFDGGILENLYQVTGVKSPIETYNRLRCIRTAIDNLAIEINGYLTGNQEVSKPDNFIPHHSLHDAAFDTSVLAALQHRQIQFVKSYEQGEFKWQQEA